MALGCYPSYSIYFKTKFFLVLGFCFALLVVVVFGGESVNTDFRKEFKQLFKI